MARPTIAGHPHAPLAAVGPAHPVGRGGESLFVWALKTYRGRKRLYREQLARPEYGHLEAHRFTRAADAERWVEAQRGLVAPPTWV